MADRRELAALLALCIAALVLSGIRPYDRLTWLLEVAPVLVGVPLLVATHRRFPLTPLAYRLLLLHALILILGAHYTYARVRLASGYRTPSIWPGTTTTASVTSPRASSPRSWRARSCCAARRWSPAGGSRSSWSACAWR